VDRRAIFKGKVRVRNTFGTISFASTHSFKMLSCQWFLRKQGNSSGNRHSGHPPQCFRRGVNHAAHPVCQGIRRRPDLAALAIHPRCGHARIGQRNPAVIQFPTVTTFIETCLPERFVLVQSAQGRLSVRVLEVFNQVPQVTNAPTQQTGCQFFLAQRRWYQ